MSDLRLVHGGLDRHPYAAATVRPGRRRTEPASHVNVRPNTAELPVVRVAVTTLELALIRATLNASPSQACHDLARRLADYVHPCRQDPDPTPPHGIRRPL